MTQPKKLIESAMPVKEISVESVRDKFIRHRQIKILFSDGAVLISYLQLVLGE